MLFQATCDHIRNKTLLFNEMVNFQLHIKIIHLTKWCMFDIENKNLQN
jgi:hypothetical protein